MTREQKYVEQLKQIGIYQPAFDPEIHTLAIMEREHQRLMKQWKKEGSPVTDVSGNGTPVSDKTWDAITALRRDILSHRDALGLTPKGLHRLRPKGVESGDEQKTQLSVLDQIRTKRDA